MLQGYVNTKPLTQIFKCMGGGPLLTEKSGPCPYTGKSLTELDIQHITVSLIDSDTGD